MIVGFQAPGTLGRALVDRKPTVRIHGDEYRVNARVHTVGGLSAHADVDDLSHWVGQFESNPRVHVVHGDEEPKQAFRQHLAESLGLRADIPEPRELLEL